jgi:hypothetical protein
MHFQAAALKKHLAASTMLLINGQGRMRRIAR